MRILITGGTGFIGQALIQTLQTSGHDIIVLTRSTSKARQCLPAEVTILSDFDQIPQVDVLINLAGERLDKKRWNTAFKAHLIDSRVTLSERVKARFDVIGWPQHIISGSAIGFYGPQDSTPLSEDAAPVDCFTHQLCQQWEGVFADHPKSTRVVWLRTGVVLGRADGAYPKLRLPVLMGLGGRLGHGEQMMSWIHIDDMVKLIVFLLETESITGPVNATAPQPVSQLALTKAMGKTLRRPTPWVTPGQVMSILFGEMAEALLLTGQAVVPTKLLAHHFSFDYPSIESALVALEHDSR